MATRTPFTSDEDNFLVKYIAKYNPTSKGRAGNTLYQRLCEDSWRDRYYKNAEEFDRKIKAYQKKHGILDEEPAKLKKGKDKVVNVVKEEEEGEDVEKVVDEGPAAPGKRKRGPVDEGKRAKMKHAPEQSRERKVSKGREEGTYVTEKGSAEARRRDGNLDAQSKSESRPRPTSSDEDRGEVVKIVAANGDGEHDRVENIEVPRIDGSMNGIERHPSHQPLYPDITKLPAPGPSATPMSAPQQGPSLPTGYDPRLSTSHVVRHQSQADPQPEASTSKVQLSPSHRIPPGSSIAFQPRRKLESKEDEFFVSAPATPSPPDRTETSRPNHRLPMLMEGPFGHRFAERRTATRGDSSSEEEEKTKTWPPSRKRNISSKDKGKAKEITRDHNARPEDPATMQKHSKTVDKRTMQSHVQGGAPLRAHQPAQVDALVPPFRTAPPLKATAEPIHSKTKGEVTQPKRPRSPLRTFKPSKIASTRQSIIKSDSVQSTSTLSRSASGATIPADSETSSSVAEKKYTRTSLLPRTSWTPGDPFTVRPAHANTDLRDSMVAQNSFSRRHTIDSAHDVQNQSKVGRRVDLRAEMAKRLHDRSSSVHSRAHSVGTAPSPSPLNNSHHTPPTISGPARRRSSLLPIPVADEDRERIEYLGVSKAIEMIANNFGFRDEDVWNAWNLFKNIARTEDFFRRFRQKTKAVEAAVLAEMEKDGVDFDALLVEQEGQVAELELRPQPQPTRQEREHGNRAISAPSASNGSSPSRRTQERDLKIKPLPVERALSEYTPPYMSRAGQYIRLVKQGRKEEAISRENRRASGGSGVFPKLRSQSAAQETPQNQTPDTRRDAGSDDKGGEMGRSDYDHLWNENADEAGAEEELHQEEEMAFLTATPRKAAKLRMIEQRMDVDYMLRWTAAQLGRFAQSRDGHRIPPHSAGLEDGE